MNIKGSNNIHITDNSNNQLMILNNTLIEIKKPLKCFEPVEFIGDCIIPNYLNIDEINALINGLSIPPSNQHTIRTANIHFMDVDNVNTFNLNIFGAQMVKFKDDINNDLLDISHFITTMYRPLSCLMNVNIGGDLVVSGDLTATNIYNKDVIDAKLLLKQDVIDVFTKQKSITFYLLHIII